LENTEKQSISAENQEHNFGYNRTKDKMATLSGFDIETGDVEEQIEYLIS
jgi:hypothetical protein